MINSVVLTGRLTRDPQMRYTGTEMPVAQFGLAVDRPRRNAQGERETDFFEIIAFGKTAEVVNQYMKKGRMVGVRGRIQIRKYTAKDNTQRTVCEILADQVAFLDSRQDQGPREMAGGAGGTEGAPPVPPAPEAVDDIMDDSELPF